MNIAKRHAELSNLTPRARQNKLDDGAPTRQHIVLSEEQTQRLLGLSYLEGGKDSSQIIDELLDLDGNRRKYEISLEDAKRVADFLRRAVERGWSLSEKPNVIDLVTQLWNLGMANLPRQTVEALIQLLSNLGERGWNSSQFVAQAGDLCEML